MKNIPKNHYIKKKVRGQKRKINQPRQNLGRLSDFFPDDSYVHDKYYHYLFPCDQEFLDSINSSNKLRSNCIQLLIDSAEKLQTKRPDSKKTIE